MNQLVKYVLIINLIFLLFGGFAVVFKLLDNNYVKDNPPAPVYGSDGLQLVQERPKEGVYYTFFIIFSIITGLSFVLAITLSANYFYYNHGFKGFFSSLIIPISLVVISLIFDYVRKIGYHEIHSVHFHIRKPDSAVKNHHAAAGFINIQIFRNTYGSRQSYKF